MSPTELAAFMANRWFHFHALVHTISEATGKPDIHVLRPTLVLPGKKPFSEKEKALLEGQVQKSAERIIEGYRELRERLNKLKSQVATTVRLRVLFKHLNRLVFSLVRFSAGRRRAARTVIMAMTTNSSTRVKPSPCLLFSSSLTHELDHGL